MRRKQSSRKAPGRTLKCLEREENFVTAKYVLDLPLLLPGIPDERDTCVERLTELLQAEGLEKAHPSARTAAPACACTMTRSASA